MTQPSPGRLYLCPTPIGNLEDITRRVVRTLEEADLVLCEDTRRTGMLLHHLGIRKRLWSYYDQVERRRLPAILKALRSGQRVALVCDAGSPVLSDPGYPLVRACIQEGIAVEALPGPTALIPALTASGLAPHPFLFLGFLPRTSTQRRRLWAQLRHVPATLVAYETPHRLGESLTDALAELGDRSACVARELTKVHEEYHRGTLSQLKEVFSQGALGEVVLVIEGCQTKERSHKRERPSTP